MNYNEILTAAIKKVFFRTNSFNINSSITSCCTGIFRIHAEHPQLNQNRRVAT